MDKKLLQSVFDEVLVTHGLSRKANAWYRISQHAVQVVELQKSNFGLQFYVNICCALDGMEVKGMPHPQPSDCPVRLRLTSIHQQSKESIDRTLDLEAHDIQDDARRAQIRTILNNIIVPSLEYLKDADSLSKAINGGKLNSALLTVAVRRYLGFPD
jgi:hypothetical protein